WTLFIGGRVDWHSYVKREMFSPRAAIVYTPNEKDTIKFIVQRSTRASMAESMKFHKEQTGRKSSYETMDYYELRWERQHNQNWWYAVSGFYSCHNIIGWEGTGFGVSPLGELQLYGVEAELAYKTEKAKIAISHGYTKLLDMKLKDQGANQFFTAKPYGYGDDLANWHNHVTKITASYDVTEKLNLYGSLNTYWGIPGKKDYVDRMGVYNVGSTPYQPSFFLNLGMGYAVTENLSVRAHAHNVLGWFNQRFNKRNFGFGDQEAGYLLEAPSLSFSMLYRF
ncbi:MAG: TonB-dependent receptor, partial [Phycisphaerae bacterium]